MNFFCTKEHYDQYIKDMEVAESTVFCLEPNEAISVSKMLFSVD